MSRFDFTSNYFEGARLNFDRCVSMLGRVDRVLEIGAHEGQSACYILQNLLTHNGTLISIDPMFHETTRLRYMANTQAAKTPEQTVQTIHDRSVIALARLVAQRQQFDFVYVDGDHHNQTVIADAVMGWQLLAPGGIMLFDDYYPVPVNGYFAGPKAGIDAFCMLYNTSFEWVITNHQIGIRKKIVNPGEKL